MPNYNIVSMYKPHPKAKVKNQEKKNPLSRESCHASDPREIPIHQLDHNFTAYIIPTPLLTLLYTHTHTHKKKTDLTLTPTKANLQNRKQGKTKKNEYNLKKN